MGYGQSYYTLRSIFMDRVPPPVINLHLRLLDVASEVPIGDLSQANPVELPRLANGHEATANGYTEAASPKAVEADVPESEKVVFEKWLIELWKEKDAKMREFLDLGQFKSKSDALEFPLRLRRKREILEAFSFFAPAAVILAGKRVFGHHS